MSNLTFFIALPIGILGFLFFFWKRLKEDYPSDQIFSLGFIIAGCILAGFFSGLALSAKQTSPYFSPQGLWFWLAFLFGSFGFIAGFFKFKLRFFETLEAGGLGFLFWVLCIYILNLQIFSIFVAVLILLFFFIDSRYKKISWYKSGKVGFAGLTVLAVFFLARSLVALVNPGMLSFVGKFDAIISSVVSFIFFISLYNLSEQ